MHGVAGREFVYHYDQCTGDDRAYGSLAGRAGLTITSQRSANMVSLNFDTRYSSDTSNFVVMIADEIF